MDILKRIVDLTQALGYDNVDDVTPLLNSIVEKVEDTDPEVVEDDEMLLGSSLKELVDDYDDSLQEDFQDIVASLRNDPNAREVVEDGDLLETLVKNTSVLWDRSLLKLHCADNKLTDDHGNVFTDIRQLSVTTEYVILFKGVPIQLKFDTERLVTKIFFGLGSFLNQLEHMHTENLALLAMLYPTEKDDVAARFFGIRSIGTFFLEFIDCLNMACGIHRCTLIDISEKKVCNETPKPQPLPLKFFLSLTRGFSWYQAFGYEAQDDETEEYETDQAPTTITTTFDKMINKVRGLQLADVFANRHPILVKLLRDMLHVEQDQETNEYEFLEGYPPELIEQLKIEQQLKLGTLTVSALFELLIIGVKNEDVDVCEHLNLFITEFMLALDVNYPDYAYTLKYQLSFTKDYKAPPQTTVKKKKKRVRRNSVLNHTFIKWLD